MKRQKLQGGLTNSLEESHPDTGTLFANWLSAEANEANQIKRDTPVMCIIGNPPYSGESANKGKWIMNLMEDYKKEPGGKEKLKERNPKWINDDYVKFLRYGQHFIEKNGSGVLAFINPHGFLDNPTFRGMRWNLLKTYDKIYTIDLHGNSKKKEKHPDGSADQNVFDIMQGVSINIFVKTGKKKENELGKVFHFDLYGKREIKYDFLIDNSIKTIDFKELPNISPNYFFVNKNFDEQKKYDKGFSVRQLFITNGSGIVSKRDSLAFQHSKLEIQNKVKDIFELSYEEIKLKYNNISWESRDGKVEFCKDNVVEFGLKDELFVNYNYRPFDIKWTYYTGKSKGFIGWPVKEVMQHFLLGENIGIITSRQSVGDWHYIFLTKLIGDFNLTGSAGRFGSGNFFPLYLYPEINGQFSTELSVIRKPNLNVEIVNQIAEKLGLTFTNEPFDYAQGATEAERSRSFAPIDILDYIYAVLHSPTYREKYKEFLKIDFPRVPYPKNVNTFWQLVKLGGEIRQIHLLESPIVEKYMTQYPIDGDNVVGKIKFVPNGEVINSEPKTKFKIKKESNTTSTDSSSYSSSSNYTDNTSFPQPHLSGNNDQLLHEPETVYQRTINGKVYINDTQYFDNVPEIAWNFYIGGYQPAQKWLKDRKNRKLEFDDILHYQKIIVALSETDRLMKEIGKIEIG